ncbi:hypothetical protein D918_10137 [Trichuris suis]|nr:hypothetical protein D918_10137 [Trichuris suis]
MDQNNGLVWETYCRFHDHLRNLEYRLERLESTKDERTSQKKFSGPTDVSKNLTSGEHDLPYKVCPLVGKPGSSTSVNPFEDSVCTQSHSTYEQHTSNESGAQSPEHLDRLMEEFLTEGKEQEQSFNVESDNSI